jgi:hypothetical protein
MHGPHPQPRPHNLVDPRRTHLTPHDAQGIFEAWDEAYEPSYLNSKNLSQTLIATSQSIAFLPWAFKVRRSGARRRGLRG